MASSPEEEIKEEIKKVEAWYASKYKKTLEVHYRYDKQEKHMSWRIVANIGGAQRVLPFGLSIEKAESKQFPEIKAKVAEYIKQSLIKAQVKWEPHILALV